MARAFLACFALALTACVALPAYAESERLDDGWAFHRGDVAGAEASAFDDGAWRRVMVPHDWSIEDLPGQTNPFAKDAPGGTRQGFMVGGVGWYRRAITLPPNVAEKSVLLRFEACYMDCELWVNGQKLLRHPYGYSAFDIDISRVARPGTNIIAIRVNHQEPSSRWYSGSGLIRPAHLEIMERTHFDPTGLAVTTPRVSVARATVVARNRVVNAGATPVDARVTTLILDRQGREVGRAEVTQAIAATGQANVEQTLVLTRPALWSTDTPHLYTLVQEVRVDGLLTDSRRTRFGVRSISFDARRGFLLNGKRVLLKGGNIHHDNYMLGAAGIPRADRRKLELLKSAGFNAIRNAHNPASQATLDAADELGMLVIDEAFDTWSQPKVKMDYARFFKENWRSDVTSWIASGRNHPSVIMWSLGNEIRTQLTPAGVQESKEIGALVRQIDPTRPTTASVNIFAADLWQDYTNTLDVAGYNYHPDLYPRDHIKYPNRIFYGAESFSRQAFELWGRVESQPYVIGDFVWASFDYLGETGTGWVPDGAAYPWHLAYTGEIDATGKLRSAAYYRRVLWKTGLTPTSMFVEWPSIKGSLGGALNRSNSNWVQDDLVPSWTGFTDNVMLKVVIFSEDDKVELFLNGASIGRKPVSRLTEYKTYFWVNFSKGELKAIGYRKSKPHSEAVLRTTNKPAAIRLTVDRPQIAADGSDLAYVSAQLVDDKGEMIGALRDDREIKFSVSGAGMLAGAGSGNPYALDSFQSGQLSTFWGRAVGVVRSSKSAGSVKVTVTVEGLPTASADIESTPEAAMPSRSQ